MTVLTLQLVFDAKDPDEIMRFWGRAVGYENELVNMSPDELREWRKGFPQFDGRGRIDDARARHVPVYIQRVPEPKHGRNRLRPELVVRDFSELGRLCPVEPGDELADVEGNEFTAIAGDEQRLRTIVFDALDPDRMLEFWSQATGYIVSGNRCDPPPDMRRFEDGALVVNGAAPIRHPLYASVPDGDAFSLAPGLAFVQTDEPKRTKNRLHVDLWTTDGERHRDRLIELGATVQQWDTDHVMLDPEGNEFCCSG
jgi:hypothetical protein